MVLGGAGCPGAIVASHVVVEKGSDREGVILLNRKMVVLFVQAEKSLQTIATMNSVHVS